MESGATQIQEADIGTECVVMDVEYEPGRCDHDGCCILGHLDRFFWAYALVW